jgi:hypothetical protein
MVKGVFTVEDVSNKSSKFRRHLTISQLLFHAINLYSLERYEKSPINLNAINPFLHPQGDVLECLVLQSFVLSVNALRLFHQQGLSVDGTIDSSSSQASSPSSAASPLRLKYEDIRPGVSVFGSTEATKSLRDTEYVVQSDAKYEVDKDAATVPNEVKLKHGLDALVAKQQSGAAPPVVMKLMESCPQLDGLFTAAHVSKSEDGQTLFVGFSVKGGKGVDP